MDMDALHWLVLQRLPETGPATINRLLDELGTPAAVLASSSARLHHCGMSAAAVEAVRRWQRDTSSCEAALRARADLDCLIHLGAGLLARGDIVYPGILASIHQPPPLLFTLGNSNALVPPLLAIVGSRKASAAGREFATRLAAELGSAGFGICSGMALGIDAAAHEGALAVGAVTVAVSAVGIDRVYPRRHTELQQRIVDTGMVLTEFPPGTEPVRANFPRRNRIISGLCVGVVVVEAAIRSGSLITARLALDQGREVFAVPGSVRNPGSRGCHALLRDGACLVESCTDVLAGLGGLRIPSVAATAVDNEPPPGLGKEARLLWSLLDDTPVCLDELTQRSSLAPAEMQAALTELELMGHLEFRAGCYCRR